MTRSYGRHAMPEGDGAAGIFSEWTAENTPATNSRSGSRAGTWPGFPPELQSSAPAASPQPAPSAEPKKKSPGFFSILIGFIGELLLTAGVLVGLYIVWQLYYTDFTANRAQAQHVEQLETQWGDPRGASKIGTPRFDDPPAIEHNTTEGADEAILRIPRFGQNWVKPVEYGVGLENVIDTGAFGHYPETQWPGEIGNYAITAHRQTYGAAMKDVDQLQIGDDVIVQTHNAYLIYKITGHDIVDPSAVEVLAPNPGHPELPAEKRMLTITTCHPPFVSDQRWITYAEFDHWVDPNEGVPAEIAGK